MLIAWDVAREETKAVKQPPAGHGLMNSTCPSADLSVIQLTVAVTGVIFVTEIEEMIGGPATDVLEHDGPFVFKSIRPVIGCTVADPPVTLL